MYEYQHQFVRADQCFVVARRLLQAHVQHSAPPLSPDFVHLVTINHARYSALPLAACRLPLVALAVSTYRCVLWCGVSCRVLRWLHRFEEALTLYRSVPLFESASASASAHALPASLSVLVLLSTAHTFAALKRFADSEQTYRKALTLTTAQSAQALTPAESVHIGSAHFHFSILLDNQVLNLCLCLCFRREVLLSLAQLFILQNQLPKAK